LAKARVLIAHKYPIVGDRLREVLNDQADIEVIGEARDGLEALKKARVLLPEVILLDVDMPNLGGLVAIRLLNAAVPQSRIVVFSTHKDETFIHQVLASGALGYVTEASHSFEIVEAIRTARRGEYFLSSQIRAGIVEIHPRSSREAPKGQSRESLSKREHQVFSLLVEGKTNRDIAELLCVSHKTVEKHRRNLLNKLGMNRLIDLVRYAIKTGVVNLDHS
jgi:DNA-binding NarL/FixJ family response regulator